MFMPPEIAMKVFDVINDYQEAMAREVQRRQGA
jgi:hypothetical protein